VPDIVVFEGKMQLWIYWIEFDDVIIRSNAAIFWLGVFLYTWAKYPFLQHLI